MAIIRRASIAPIAVSLLVSACVALATLQYRWTNEISAAGLDQLHKELGNRMEFFSRSLDDAIEAAIGTAVDGPSPLFLPGSVETWHRNPGVPESPGPRHPPGGSGVEVRRPGGITVFAELNPAFLRESLFPSLLKTSLSGTAGLEYDAIVIDARDPATVIYESAPGIAARVLVAPDASAGLLPDQPHGRPPEPPRGGPGSGFRRLGRGPGPPGRWRLVVRHRTGSLEAIVAKARRRNMAVSGAMLLLIVATTGLLVLLSRRHEELAALKMNFVAGVSHELRTLSPRSHAPPPSICRVGSAAIPRKWSATEN